MAINPDCLKFVSVECANLFARSFSRSYNSVGVVEIGIVV